MQCQVFKYRTMISLKLLTLMMSGYLFGLEFEIGEYFPACMALQSKLIACGNTLPPLPLRFLTGPAVMAAAAIVVGIRGTLLHVAIMRHFHKGLFHLFFAKEYNIHPQILSTGFFPFRI